ncbi:MAG: hypothetical protein LBT47_06085, partial [Deltaproteobacteria bacterium]|nr:hypothetical protein [Deltaproteobacteria bacterium]
LLESLYEKVLYSLKHPFSYVAVIPAIGASYMANILPYRRPGCQAFSDLLKKNFCMAENPGIQDTTLSLSLKMRHNR